MYNVLLYAVLKKYKVRHLSITLIYVRSYRVTMHLIKICNARGNSAPIRDLAYSRELPKG